MNRGVADNGLLHTPRCALFGIRHGRATTGIQALSKLFKQCTLMQKLCSTPVAARTCSSCGAPGPKRGFPSIQVKETYKLEEFARTWWSCFPYVSFVCVPLRYRIGTNVPCNIKRLRTRRGVVAVEVLDAVHVCNQDAAATSVIMDG